MLEEEQGPGLSPELWTLEMESDRLLGERPIGRNGEDLAELDISYSSLALVTSKHTHTNTQMLGTQGLVYDRQELHH